MRVRSLTATLASVLVLAACGDSGSSSSDTTADTQGADTQGDVVTADTGDEDSASNEDTATTEDTATAEDTAVADTSTVDDTVEADTTPIEDPAAKTCPGILTCFDANCVGLPLAQQQACVQECMAKGDADEQQAVVNLQTCVQTKNCIPADTSDESLKGAFECQRQCLPQTAACFAGSFGTGGCSDLSGCLENCLDTDIMCQRDCFSAASEEQAQYYIDYEYCGLSQCYNTQDPIAQDTCLQQVQGDNAPCSGPYQQCFGGVGAGPGPGPGGSAE